MSRTRAGTWPLALVLSMLSAPAQGTSSAALPRQETALHTVESQDGRFRVKLPEALPVPDTKSRSTILGDVHEAHYVLSWGRARVSVEFYDIPELAALILPSGLLLDQAASGLVEDVRGRELDRRPLERQELPARLVTYALPGDPGAIERALIVLASSRLYVVAVTAPPGASLGPQLERVIESFEVVGP